MHHVKIDSYTAKAYVRPFRPTLSYAQPTLIHFTLPARAHVLDFTNQSCKALQYTDRGLNGSSHNYILVSRVVLGLIHRTQEQCPSFIKPPDGFDSVMAGPFTKSQLGHLGLGFDFQLHNEHIVYDDSACYPEFVLVMP